MTTAFSWFVRGRLAPAWQANPAGLLIASVGLPLIPWSLAAAATAHAWKVRRPGEFLMALVVVATAVTLLTWLVRRGLSSI
jgi:hypothetical protein